jgi:hypothetical protein
MIFVYNLSFMQNINLQFRTMFAELIQQSLDDRFLQDFSTDGSFYIVKVKNQGYWYYSSNMIDGKRKRHYVGPASDEDITHRVQEFKQLKTNASTRRSMVLALNRVGLPSPDIFTGNIVEALSNSGFFRLRGVLVGTVAFQTYAGMLGVRFPNATLQTGDSDFAQFHSISVAVEDSLPPMLKILNAVDPSFRDIPHQMDARKTTKYQNENGFQVDFLTPNTGSDDYSGKPTTMPALGGASAVPLRFLDFLIHEPKRSVLLHKYGVGVTVPLPERYAVHKLIVASRRRTDDYMKASKDVWQSGILIEALIQMRMEDLLFDAFKEAVGRGSAWKQAIEAGLKMSTPETRNSVKKLLNSLF